MPWACRSRPASPASSLKPPTARSSNCSAVTRAPTDRSPPPTPPPASACRSPKSNRPSVACMPRENCSKESSAPKASQGEWGAPGVLQQARRKPLARLRREVVPAEQHTFVRLLTRWHGVAVPRRGLDALLDSIEILQGAALTASELEREILPARVLDYSPGDLDALMAS